MKNYDGVFYKNHWATTLITLVGFAVILYVDRMYLEFILSSAWVYLLLLLPLLLLLRKSRSHIIIFNRSSDDVETILDENLSKYNITFSKKREGNTDDFKYLLEDTNEKIKLKVGLSFFSHGEEEDDDTIHLHVNKKGEDSYLSEALVSTKEQIRELSKGKGFRTRIRFQGWILVFSTLLLFSFFFRNLLG